jgi:hypothetical protein
MKTFNLTEFLKENREIVIASYDKIKGSEFFTQITLSQFMTTILNRMAQQNAKSAKRAMSILPTIIGEVSFNNSRPHTF